MDCLQGRAWSFIATVVLTAILGAGGAVAAFYVPAYPATYTHELTATGLVERVRYLGLRKRHCVVEIAVYTWINLSSGFPLQDLPQEGDRTAFFAPADTCVAVQVAAAGADGHILYKAGEGASDRWYLTTRPEPALRCGGRFNWQPPPRKG